jgi:cyclophilin family peptidyl-prolyl cis-trans isomerase
VSKNQAKAKLFGTGGLGVLKAETSREKHTRGAVAAVLQPGRPDSAGSQFFICVTDQPALDGNYSIFGRVSEGMDVVQKISETPAGSDGAPSERIEIHSVTIRDTPPQEPEPFSTESAADLARVRAVLETTAGPITIEFFHDKAIEHTRAFLRLAAADVFDGTSFHRVVRGFVIQTGSLTTRGPLTEKQQKLVRPCSRSSTTRSTSKASCRWRAGTIRQARPRRFSSSPAMPPRSMASTRPSAAWSRDCLSSKPSS